MLLSASSQWCPTHHSSYSEDRFRGEVLERQSTSWGGSCVMWEDEEGASANSSTNTGCETSASVIIIVLYQGSRLQPISRIMWPFYKTIRLNVITSITCVTFKYAPVWFYFFNIVSYHNDGLMHMIIQGQETVLHSL